MQYTEFIPTRLTPEMAARVRALAAELEITESAVMRIAVRRFFEYDRRISDEPAIRKVKQEPTRKSKARRSVEAQKKHESK